MTTVRDATTARRADRAAVGWAWTGRNLILDEALHGIILQRRTARAKSAECGVFDKVLSNQYQMFSASIFVPAAQNMLHIKVFKMTLIS